MSLDTGRVFLFTLATKFLSLKPLKNCVGLGRFEDLKFFLDNTSDGKVRGDITAVLTAEQLISYVWRIRSCNLEKKIMTF